MPFSAGCRFAARVLAYVRFRAATVTSFVHCSFMEHDGVGYTIVQTANPTGWRWTVELTPPFRTRTGAAPTKAAAIRKALSVIDKLRREQPRR